MKGVGFAAGAAWVDDPTQKDRVEKKKKEVSVSTQQCRMCGNTLLRADVTLWFRVDVPGVLVSSSSSSSS